MTGKQGTAGKTLLVFGNKSPFRFHGTFSSPRWVRPVLTNFRENGPLAISKGANKQSGPGLTPGPLGFAVSRERPWGAFVVSLVG
jgi:hypothetical protein